MPELDDNTCQNVTLSMNIFGGIKELIDDIQNVVMDVGDVETEVMESLTIDTYLCVSWKMKVIFLLLMK